MLPLNVDSFDISISVKFYCLLVTVKPVNVMSEIQSDCYGFVTAKAFSHHERTAAGCQAVGKTSVECIRQESGWHIATYSYLSAYQPVSNYKD